MNRHRIAAALAAGLFVLSIGTLHADVRADEKTHFEFAGVLGKVVNFFGGKAAREGVTSSVAVKGDRKARMNGQTGEIVDLAEQKIYSLDLKKKTYTVATFAEIRRQMEEARKKAEESAQKQEGKKEAPAEKPGEKQDQKQVEIDVAVKNTGERKMVNGFDTRQQIVTVTVREKGKTLEESGGLVLTTDMWMAPPIPAMKEITDFELRAAQQLYGPTFADASREQMAMAMAMYPQMKEAMGRMSQEGAKIDGTAILTTVTFDAVKSAEQVADEAKQKDDDAKPSAANGVGGLLGGFAKKMAAKKAGSGDDENKSRVTFMTSTTEVLKVDTTVSAADVAIPAGFKETK